MHEYSGPPSPSRCAGMVPTWAGACGMGPPPHPHPTRRPPLPARSGLTLKMIINAYQAKLRYRPLPALKYTPKYTPYQPSINSPLHRHVHEPPNPHPWPLPALKYLSKLPALKYNSSPLKHTRHNPPHPEVSTHELAICFKLF